MTDLSAALREAYANAPTDVVIHDTLEIRHPAFTAPIRVVAGVDDLVATLEDDAPADAGQAVTFLAVMFDFAEPEQSSAGAMPTFDVSIDGVSGVIAREIKAAAETLDVIEVTYRPYLNTDLTAPHMTPPLTAKLTDVQASLTRVTGRCGFDDLTNKRFPSLLYTAENTPGLL